MKRTFLLWRNRTLAFWDYISGGLKEVVLENADALSLEALRGYRDRSDSPLSSVVR